MNLIRSLCLATLFVLLHATPSPAQAQTNDNFYPTHCRQNGGSEECIVGEFNKYSVECGIPVNGTAIVASAGTAGACLDQWIINANAFAATQPGYENLRYRIDTACGEEGWIGWGINGNPSESLYVASCWVSLYYVSTGGAWGDRNVFEPKRRVTCEEGWSVFGSGYSHYHGAPHICHKAVSPKNQGCCRLSVGNPINIATGNKYERATDWAIQGGTNLAIVRHYNSEGTRRSIDLGVNWRLDYDRRVLFDGRTTAHVLRGDGKAFQFRFDGAAWIGDLDVNDHLMQQVNGMGVRTGWTYYQASTESVETYSASGVLLQISERNGHVTVLTYSTGSTPSSIAPGPGFLIGVTDTFERAISLAYLSDGKLATITTPDGSSYEYDYDASGRLSSVTAPGPVSRTYHYESTYNPNAKRPGALTGITDENNARFSIYTYAANTGKAVSTEHAGGVNKYSAVGNPALVTDPLGTERQYYINFSHGVAKPVYVYQPCSTPGCSGSTADVHSYDANGNLSAYTDFNGNRTAYTFDLTRNLELSRTEGQQPSGASTPQTRTITTTWHATYRLPLTITEPTVAGNKVTTFTYDSAGNVLTKSIAVGGNTRTWTWSNYDAYGRPGTVDGPRGDVTDSTSYEYYPNTSGQNSVIANSRGMLKRVTNALGHVTEITAYNAHGQPLSMTDANGLVTTMTYDARQRLKTRNVGGETISYDYDNVGQLTKVTLTDSSYLEYTYDGAHRLIEIKDGLNNKISYTLDNMGNRIAENYKDPAAPSPAAAPANTTRSTG